MLQPLETAWTSWPSGKAFVSLWLSSTVVTTEQKNTVCSLDWFCVTGAEMHLCHSYRVASCLVNKWKIYTATFARIFKYLLKGKEIVQNQSTAIITNGFLYGEIVGKLALGTLPPPPQKKQRKDEEVSLGQALLRGNQVWLSNCLHLCALQNSICCV